MNDFEKYIKKYSEKKEMTPYLKRRIGHLFPRIEHYLICHIQNAYTNQFDGWYDYTLSIIRWTIDDIMEETNENIADDLYWETREMFKEYIRDVYGVSIRKYYIDKVN